MPAPLTLAQERRHPATLRGWVGEPDDTTLARLARLAAGTLAHILRRTGIVAIAQVPRGARCL